VYLSLLLNLSIALCLQALTVALFLNIAKTALDNALISPLSTTAPVWWSMASGLPPVL